MADATLDFPTRFYRLQGEQISERKKNFSKLLRDPAFQSNDQQFYIMLKNLETKNCLEKLFKVDTLIYFKRSAELLEILKNDTNEIFLKKIIKQHWFIEEVFKDISAKVFVNDILPCMSYSIKMKLLKKISLVCDESKIDVLFDNLLKCYGLAVAKRIFHKCSSNKILIVLEEHEIKLNVNQVKCIFDRDIDLFSKYLQYYKKNYKSIYNESKVIDYVALKNPKFLLALEDSNIIRFNNLGRRKSKRVFDYVKLQHVKEVEKYTRLLNKAVIVRKLGNEFPNVYQSIFPTKIYEINSFNLCHRLLLLYPKNKRWELLVKTFTTKFNNSDISDLFLKFHDISKFNPDRVSIQNWAVAHYTSTNSEKYLKYYDLSKSIIIIKDKINVTSDIYKRGSLVTLLIAACAENKDLIALEDVLKYICTRHRNEECSFRYQILNTLRNAFNLEEFNENHWKYINEQLKLLRIQNDYRNCDNQIFVKYLEYLFKQGKPITEDLLQLISNVLEHNCSFVLNLQSPEVESQILVKLTQIVPNVINKNNKEYGTYYAKLISYIIKFNFENIKFAVNLNDFSYLIDYIKVLFEKVNELSTTEYDILEHILLYNSNFPSIAISLKEDTVLKVISAISLGFYNVPTKLYEAMLLKKNRSHLENDVLKFYFEKSVEHKFESTIFNWFLINEPNTILPYFDGFLKNNLETCLFRYKSIKYMKYYSHIGFDKKVYELFTNEADDLNNTENDTLINIVNNLRLLLSTDEFITIVNKYFLPNKIKLDPDDVEMRKFYNVQCKILKQFHSVTEPSKILPVIMQFSQGDYLKFSLPALYSTFYRTPERNLKVVLSILSSRALSVKKHALFLSCEVMEQAVVLEMLRVAKLSNKSSQKHLFSSILKYFLKSPSQELFSLLIENVNTINENDSENLENLQSVHIPCKYKVVYIEKCWEFYESLEMYGVKYKNYLKNFLRSIVESTQIVANLSSKFVNRIVDVYFKALDEELDCDMFIVLVLKYRASEQISNFNVIFQILLNFPSNKLHRFFTIFFDNNIKKTNKDFVQVFTEYWNKTFSVIDTFKQTISLKLLCYHHCSTSIEMYSQYIVNYMDQLMKEFGYHIFEIFMSTLKLIVEKVKEDINKYLLCLNILKIKCSADTSILVLGILNKSYEHTEDISSVYNEIINILENIDDKAVRIYYKYYSIGG